MPLLRVIPLSSTLVNHSLDYLHKGKYKLPQILNRVSKEWKQKRLTSNFPVNVNEEQFMGAESKEHKVRNSSTSSEEEG